MARTFYEVLMLRPEADRELITAVYRHLAKRYHPDRDDSPEAATRMAELNEAYATLGDPAKRASYDRQIGLQPVEPAPLRKGDGRPVRAGAANTSAASTSGPFGEAGPPPPTPQAQGRPLTFGRYRGWTLNQVARYDAGYLEWLSRTTMGRNYKRELDELRHR